MEGIRIGEEAVLKTVELKGFGGSIPSPSAGRLFRPPRLGQLLRRKLTTS